MKISFINSFGALALAGLSVSLIPSPSMAGDFARGERHAARHYNRLPHGARCVSYRGERCWFSGGAYYRINPLGGFVLFQPEVETAVIEQPVYQETVVVKRPVVKKTIVEEEVVEQPVVRKRIVEEPVVEETQEVVVEEPVLEEEDTVVEELPEGSEVVVIGGERCWLRDGVYYRHCNHGYKVCHPHGNGSKWHNHDGHSTKGHPMSNHGHEPHQTKNHGDMGSHMPHQTKNMGHQGGKHDKHN